MGLPADDCSGEERGDLFLVFQVSMMCFLHSVPAS